jgi:tRNA uridine 5-carboxymethylaminomethyl modification enzyme
LFTARSENRLYIREDNTLLRMAKYRQMLGLNSAIDTFHNEFIDEVELLSKLVSGTMYYSNESNKEYFSKNNYGPIENNLSLSELLKRPGLNPIEVLVNESLGLGASFNYDVIKTVAIAVKYEGYIDRALLENDKLNRLSKKTINWERLSSSMNISFECKIRIKSIRPETFGQLQRIEGIRPATLAYVAGNLV